MSCRNRYSSNSRDWALVRYRMAQSSALLASAVPFFDHSDTEDEDDEDDERLLRRPYRDDVVEKKDRGKAK